MRSEEQNERYALLNKHIEQQAQLNGTIKKLSREQQQLSSQLKKAELERDLTEESKLHMVKELEMR